MREVRGEEAGGGVGFDADVHVDSVGAQPLDALAPDVAIGILDGDDDPGHTGVDQRVGARRSAAIVRAGLEGDVGGGADRSLARTSERFDLGVWATGRLGGPDTDDFAVTDDEAADPRVGRRTTAGRGGHGERPAHELGVRVHAVRPLHRSRPI